MQLNKVKNKLFQCLTSSALLFSLHAEPLLAINFQVNSTIDNPILPGTLRFALLNASSTNGDTITFDPSLVGSTITLIDSLPMVNGVPIFGPATGNATINGNGLYSGFFINSGTTTVSNLTFSNTVSKGGSGGNGLAGGGGALGAGAGIFVNSGTVVTLQNVAFTNNASIGGSGGTFNAASGGAGGGGGGFNSNGGNSIGGNSAGIITVGSGGGGGLFNSKGGDAQAASLTLLAGGGGGGGVNSAPGGVGLASGGGGGGYLKFFSSAGGNGVDGGVAQTASGAGGGGIGTVPGSQGNPGLIGLGPTIGGTGGNPTGGTGGVGAGDGNPGGVNGGGGGGGGGGNPFTPGGDGGTGSPVGGGGGGGGVLFGNGGDATLGGGGGGSSGANLGGNGGSVSGIGGGGGGGATDATGTSLGGNAGLLSGGGGGATGGTGGFGGGGGGSVVAAVPAAGGFGAGAGGIASNGGENGSGFGGALFVRNGGTLIMNDCHFAGSFVAPGGIGAFAAGQDMYLMNNSSVNYTVSSPSAVESFFIGGFDDQSTFQTGQGGSLTKNGLGTLVLNSTSNVTYNGSLTVNGGTLIVNNVIGSSATVNTGSQLIVNGNMQNVNVNNATLVANGMMNNVVLNAGLVMGTGVMNSLTMNGGTLSPGNAIGALGTINIGTLNQNNSSTTQIDINPEGQSDLINVMNTANIAGAINFTASPGFYFAGTTYTFLQTGNGLSGTYSLVSMTFPLVGTILYNPFSAQLLLTKNAFGFGLPRLDGNAGAVEKYITNLKVCPSSDLAFALKALNTTSNHILENELLQLQPSWFGDLDWSTENTLANTTQLISNNVLARMRDYKCSSTCDPQECFLYRNAWVAGIGGHLQQNAIDELPAFHSHDYGLISGFDFVLSDWLIIGLGAGYSKTDLSWDDLGGTNAINNFFIGPYLAWNCGRWTVDASILKGFHHYRTKRHINYGSVSRHAKNVHYGDSIDLHVGSSLAYQWPGLWNFEPYINADYIYIHGKSIKEDGGKGLDLHVDAHDIQFFQGEIGMAFSKSYTCHSSFFIPTFTIGFQNITPLVGTKFRSRFKQSKHDGCVTCRHPDSFVVKTTNKPIYQWTTGVFLNFYIQHCPEFAVSYNGTWGNKRREHSYTGEVNWSF